MKKIVIGALMIGLLAACGGAKDSYSYTDKVALSKKVMKSDSKAIKEYEEIMKKLSEKATKGDQDAMKEAQECNIKFVPYISGFFITIPVDGAQAVCDKLQEENIFMVPLKKGIRLAVCSVSKKKMTGLAAKLREAMDAVGAKQ